MSIENPGQVPHVVQDDGDGGSGVSSNSTSSPDMFGDASDESGQIHAIQQIEDVNMEAVNPTSNTSTARAEASNPSDGRNQIPPIRQIDDVSMGMSIQGAISTSSMTDQSFAAFSGNGDHVELYSDLTRAYGRHFIRRAVVWKHTEEEIFSSAYVCPFSGECFLSGQTIDNIGYAGEDRDLQWYNSREFAQHAAISRMIDCSNFRELPPDSTPDGNRRCQERPYRADGQVLPAAIPEDARQKIQLYQQRACEPDTPSLAFTDVSPLAPPDVGPPPLRPPPEDRETSTQNLLLRAPLVDKNARLVLNERYQSGVINGRYVQQCSIPDSNFLFYEMGTSHEPYYTCIFVCPLFGECYASGEPVRDPSSAHLIHGLRWFRRKPQAKMFAAARAIDCFEYRQGNSNNGERYCTEAPFTEGNGPPLDMRWQRVFSAKIQHLQAEANQRLQRFSRQIYR